MKKTIVLILMVILTVHIACSQETSGKKSKIYQAWIKQNNNLPVTKGYLWEVSDSSVFLVFSLYNPQPREFGLDKLDILKIRRDRSIQRGAFIGAGIGAATGIIIVNSVEGGLSFLALPVSTYAGLVFGLAGAGIGTLAGSVRDRIPVGGSLSGFNRYKGSLLNYSFQQEQITAPKFEHRAYFGFETGISFAGGEFAAVSDIPVEGYSSMVKTGSAAVFHGGYRFNRTIGINLSLNNHSYNLDFVSVPPSTEFTPSWSLDALLIGPVLSLPFQKRWSLDLSPSFGFAGTSLSDGENFVLNGGGFGYQIKGLLSWHYAKRWTASLESGYLSSKVKYKEGGAGKARAFHISAGINYQFGKKSL
jgi:hypothetical protein